MAKILSNRDTSLLFREIQQKLTKNYDRNSFIHPKLTQFDSYKDNFGRKKLIDLNYDVLFLILNELNILDTLNLLKVYPDETLSAVAAADFRRKYKGHTVNIDAYSESSDVGTNRTIEVDAHSTIAVFQFKISKNLLKHFGAVIERLAIRSSHEQFPTQFYVFSTLSQWIYKYAGRSLKCLNLNYIFTNMLVHLNKPFKKLEKLAFTIHHLNNQSIWEHCQ